jgi:hypothetical protein
MPHIILLGYSVFDNQAYVPGGPDVLTHLRECLEPEWRITLYAVDGARIEDVIWQLSNLPDDASHLVLSVGGNNALSHIGILEDNANSVEEVLSALADIAERFIQSYGDLVRRLKELQKPLTLCTIYHPPLSEPVMRRLALTALPIFNDAILRVSFAERLPVIDLRLVCNEEEDFVNEIEPSNIGGAKIAAAVARTVDAELSSPASCVFAD